jgi:hypothetical protein
MKQHDSRSSNSSTRASGIKIFHLGPIILLATSLSSCVVVDNFAGRSVDYNLQAEHSKNENLLLNVVRAAYRKPLQFTELMTVTGQASASVTGVFTLPFAANHAAATRIFSFSPGAAVSGGPNFTVAVLNTKEFYQGILTPIPMQIVALFFYEGFPKSVLLTLAALRFEYGPKDGPMTEVYNDVSSTEKYMDFKIFIESLIDAGLDTEKITDTVVLGPPLIDADVRDIKNLQNLHSQGVEISRHLITDENPNLLTEELEHLKRKGYTYYYQLQTKKTLYRFCFHPLRANPKLLDQSLAKQITREIGQSGEYQFVPEILCGASERDRKSKHAIVLEISPRSVEGIIYYLGEIVRRQLNLEGRDLFEPTVKNDNILFKVTRTPAAGASISTTYEGVDYYVSVDPLGHDRSVQVMEFVTQLFALSNSAKDLPAPSFISVITR